MKKMIQKFSSYFDPPLIFLLVFGVGIFLGDGKQPVVDAFFAISIVLLFGCALYKKQIQSLSRPLFYSWLALLVYNLALIPFSDSPGFSITSFMRLVMVFIVFVYGYSFSEKIDMKKLESILLGIISAVCFVSFGLLLFPDFARVLPLMNLLYPTYGHNHIVDLLLIGIPVGIYKYLETKDKKTLASLVLFFLTLFFSFARGAIGLIGFFILFFIWKNKVYKKPLLLLFGLIMALLVGVSSVGKFEISMYGNYKISITKPKLVEDGRLEYWRQGWFSIKERPWFGSGPGTFSLESRRLQDRPGSYSWFAHSFPLETLVEIGTIGALLYVAVGWMIVKNLRNTKENSGMLWGIGLSLLYSLFEFNLNYVSIFLLLFFFLGLNIKAKSHAGHPVRLFIIPLVVLFFYYLSFVGSMMFSATGNDTAAFYSAPYLEQTAKQLILKDDDKKGEHTKMIAWFHAMNPEILFNLAHPSQKNLLKNAVLFDPQNDEYRREWLGWLIDKGMVNDVSEQIKWFVKKMTTENNARLISSVDFASPFFLPLYEKNKVLLLAITPPSYAKFFYLLGLEVLSKNPIVTQSLWAMSRDLVPNWGYFSVELASLEHWVFHDGNKAQKILRVCSNNNYAKEYCEKVVRLGIPPSGSLKKKILEINAL